MNDDVKRGLARLIFNPRVIIAGLIASISVITYFSHSSKNSITGRSQHISISAEDEVAIGQNAAPEMARQFGGLSRDAKGTAAVKQIGEEIVKALPSDAAKYPFEYHLLADNQTVNAFALPGGQVFITMALYSRLETPGQLAGVLGHETGHVIARHSAEQMAKAGLTQGLVGAATVAGSGGHDGGRLAQAAASTVANMVSLKYSRTDELEADQLGLRLMTSAGYDPRSMIDVMEILEKASGGGRQSDFLSTHPNPGNRIERINEHLKEMFPSGVPSGLKK